MTPELARAYLANTIAGMSLEQLKMIIMKLGEKYPEDVGMVVLGKHDIPINDQVMVAQTQSSTNQLPPPLPPVMAPRVPPVAAQDLETISVDGDEVIGQAISRKRKDPSEAALCTTNKFARIDPPNPTISQPSSNSKDVAHPKQDKLDMLAAGAKDSTRARLCRLAIIMDKLDWALVRTRSDVYDHLSRGKDELCRDPAYDSGTYMNRAIIGSFIYRHHIRLGVYNTAFTKSFQAHGQPLHRGTELQIPVVNVSPSPSPPPPEPPVQRSAPPLDWAVVSAHFKLLNNKETETSVTAIADAFQISYKNIIRDCDTEDTKIGDIFRLFGQTAELATNMNQARPRVIYNRLMADRPFIELQQCVMKLCVLLAEQDKAVMKETSRHRRDRLYSKMVRLSWVFRGHKDSEELRNTIHAVQQVICAS